MIEWWCTALERPWSWAWIPYPGVWLATLLPIAFYVRSLRNHSEPVDRRKLAQFIGGMFVFWIASDWPLGALGAGYLASAHMTQFLLYTLGAAPLLLLGTPEWMARRVVSKLRIYRASVWLAAGFVLWLPVASPIPEGRVQSVWTKMIYLFVTTAVVAVIPASFLTFATTPIYAIYELAPRIGSITAREDQQFAGIIMKLATIPVIWATIGVMWFRWSAHEARLTV